MNDEENINNKHHASCNLFKKKQNHLPSLLLLIIRLLIGKKMKRIASFKMPTDRNQN